MCCQVNNNKGLLLLERVHTHDQVYTSIGISCVAGILVFRPCAILVASNYDLTVPWPPPKYSASSVSTTEPKKNR